MSHTIPIEEAASRLAELVRDLAPGDEIHLMDHRQRVVATISPKESPTPVESSGHRVPGAAKGMLEIVGDLDDDTDVHEMFKEYME